jgi:tetratricopeptide (TPR) repeat protein
LHAMGEDDEKRGDLAAALKKFEEAHRATAAVLGQRPDDPDAIFAHAQSEYWVGYGLQGQDRYSQAIASYQRYLGLANRFAQKSPNNPVAKKDIGWAHNAMGVIFLRKTGNLMNAQVQFQEYLNVFAALAAARPNDQEALYSMADAHGWLADTSFAAKNFDSSLEHRHSQIKILAKLILIEPHNDTTQLEWVSAHRSIFRTCFRLNNFTCANGALSVAEDNLRKRDFDKSNRDWLWQAAYVYLDRGYLDERQGRLIEAKLALKKAIQFSLQYKGRARDRPTAVKDLKSSIDTLSRKIFG